MPPMQAIESVCTYLETTMIKAATDRFERAKPSLFLQQEVIDFVKNKYSETFKVPYSIERYNELTQYYNEMNPKCEPRKKIISYNASDDSDELPF